MFYGWIIVGLALVANGMSSGPVWSGVGVWIKALELHFGWSRAQLTGAFSMAQLEGSIIGPLMGYLIDRLGPRRMILIGFIITGLGFLVFSRTDSIYIFYLSYGMIMLGTAAGTWLPFMSMVNRWFVRKRGVSMAVAGLGSPLGGLVLVPILAWAITPGSHGWSVTAQWIGVAFLCVAWPMSQLIRVRPEDYGLRPDGDPPDSVAGETLRSSRRSPSPDQLQFTGRQAIRTLAFWLITFGHAFSSILFATLTVHLVPMLTDQGLSLQQAANMFSVVMGVAAVFQMIGGYAGDRLPKNVVIAFFGFIQAGGFLLAVLVDSMPMAILFAITFWCGFRWQKSADHRHTGRLLRRKSLCHHHRHIQRPDVHAHAGRPAVCGVHVRRNQELHHFVPGHREPGSYERRAVPYGQKANLPPVGQKSRRHPPADGVRRLLKFSPRIGRTGVMPWSPCRIAWAAGASQLSRPSDWGR